MTVDISGFIIVRIRKDQPRIYISGYKNREFKKAVQNWDSLLIIFPKKEDRLIHHFQEEYPQE